METNEPETRKKPEFQAILDELNELNKRAGIILEKVSDINEGLIGEPIEFIKEVDPVPVNENFILIAGDAINELKVHLDRIDRACNILLQEIK